LKETFLSLKIQYKKIYPWLIQQIFVEFVDVNNIILFYNKLN